MKQVDANLLGVTVRGIFRYLTRSVRQVLWVLPCLIGVFVHVNRGMQVHESVPKHEQSEMNENEILLAI